MRKGARPLSSRGSFSEECGGKRSNKRKDARNANMLKRDEGKKNAVTLDITNNTCVRNQERTKREED